MDSNNSGNGKNYSGSWRSFKTAWPETDVPIFIQMDSKEIYQADVGIDSIWPYRFTDRHKEFLWILDPSVCKHANYSWRLDGTRKMPNHF